MNSDKIKELYKDVVSIDQALEIIADQDMIIGKLTRRVEFVTNTIVKLNDSRDRMKREAGYPSDTSFDIVWSETLKKAKS